MKKCTVLILFLGASLMYSCAPATWTNFEKTKFREDARNWAQGKSAVAAYGANYDDFVNCYCEQSYLGFKTYKEYLMETPAIKEKRSNIFSSCLNKAAKWTAIPTGMVATDGVEIKAIDKSFTLKQGERFNTPFACEQRLTEDATNPIVRDVHKILNGEYNGYKVSKVMVKTPYQKEELYGVLLFSDVPQGCQNSLVTRSYRIEIPKDYVTAALGGRVSCLYEYYNCGGSERYTTWVLWLSDAPF